MHILYVKQMLNKRSIIALSVFLDNFKFERKKWIINKKKFDARLFNIFSNNMASMDGGWNEGQIYTASCIFLLSLFYISTTTRHTLENRRFLEANSNEKFCGTIRETLCECAAPSSMESYIYNIACPCVSVYVHVDALVGVSVRKCVYVYTYVYVPVDVCMGFCMYFRVS